MDTSLLPTALKTTLVTQALMKPVVGNQQDQLQRMRWHVRGARDWRGQVMLSLNK